MRIWILDCDVDNYENLTWEQNVNIEYIQSFDGSKKADGWVPIKVKRIYDRDFSNVPGFSPHIPVFDKETIDVLYDLLLENVEILPLECKYGNFYAINVIKVIDCIDYKKSKYKTYRDGKRIMRFTKYAFYEEKVKEIDIFKISDEPLKRPLVSDEFRKRVIDNNLKGFKFELAWDSEKD